MKNYKGIDRRLGKLSNNLDYDKVLEIEKEENQKEFERIPKNQGENDGRAKS